jgi:hypothetical protein
MNILELTRPLIVGFLLALPFGVSAKSHGQHPQKSAFRQANPCPANGATSGECPGFVIAYVRPRACGGADTPDNMEWRTRAMDKQSDNAERKNCEKHPGRS